jgi:cysteine desulfurase
MARSGSHWGDANTENDVDFVLEVLPKVVTKLREMSPLYQKSVKDGGCNVQ